MAKARKEVRADLSTRLNIHRERDKARELERRLAEIRKYVDGTVSEISRKIPGGNSKDLLALVEFSWQDLCGTLLLAIVYGQARGFRAAAGEVVA